MRYFKEYISYLCSKCLLLNSSKYAKGEAKRCPDDNLKVPSSKKSSEFRFPSACCASRVTCCEYVIPNMHAMMEILRQRIIFRPMAAARKMTIPNNRLVFAVNILALNLLHELGLEIGIGLGIGLG